MKEAHNLHKITVLSAVYGSSQILSSVNGPLLFAALTTMIRSLVTVGGEPLVHWKLSFNMKEFYHCHSDMFEVIRAVIKTLAHPAE